MGQRLKGDTTLKEEADFIRKGAPTVIRKEKKEETKNKKNTKENEVKMVEEKADIMGLLEEIKSEMRAIEEQRKLKEREKLIYGNKIEEIGESERNKTPQKNQKMLNDFLNKFDFDVGVDVDVKRDIDIPINLQNSINHSFSSIEELNDLADSFSEDHREFTQNNFKDKKTDKKDIYSKDKDHNNREDRAELLRYKQFEYHKRYNHDDSMNNGLFGDNISIGSEERKAMRRAAGKTKPLL